MPLAGAATRLRLAREIYGAYFIVLYDNMSERSSKRVPCRTRRAAGFAKFDGQAATTSIAWASRSSAAAGRRGQTCGNIAEFERLPDRQARIAQRLRAHLGRRRRSHRLRHSGKPARGGGGPTSCYPARGAGSAGDERARRRGPCRSGRCCSCRGRLRCPAASHRDRPDSLCTSGRRSPSAGTTCPSGASRESIP